MEISNIRVVKTGSILKDDTNSRLLAYAGLTLDGCVRIENIRIIRGDKGDFLSFPSKLRKNGSRQDVVHPVSAEARTELTNAVMEVFKK